MCSWFPTVCNTTVSRVVQDHDVQLQSMYSAHIAHIVTCNALRSLTLHVRVTRSQMRGTQGHEKFILHSSNKSLAAFLSRRIRSSETNHINHNKN